MEVCANSHPKNPDQLYFCSAAREAHACLVFSSATGAAHAVVASAEATNYSAEWRSLCRTGGAYTGGAAFTGAAVSSFFDLLLVFLSSSFVAAFMSHRSMFWGTCCSALIWGCTSQTQYVLCCLDCEGSMRGNCACSSHPRVVLSVGCVVERPRRAPVKAWTVYPRSGHLRRGRSHSQYNFMSILSIFSGSA